MKLFFNRYLFDVQHVWLKKQTKQNKKKTNKQNKQTKTNKNKQTKQTKNQQKSFAIQPQRQAYGQAYYY